MHLPLPPCLFDSTVRSGSYLTLLAWKIHGSLDWALLGYKPSPSYLAHALFFPVSVGLADDPAMPLHDSCYDITSLLLCYYPWTYELRLLLVHFLHSFFFWANWLTFLLDEPTFHIITSFKLLLGHVLAMPAHPIPWASLAYFISWAFSAHFFFFTSFTPMSFC